MKPLGIIARYGVIALLIVSGCSKEHPAEPLANKTPHTYLWLFPDSTISEGLSKQHLRWWGEDPDGVVRGFLFAFGRIVAPGGVLPSPDTLRYTWTTKNDTLIAFPLLTKRDTFEVAIRGVDNHFTLNLPEHAVIRLSPSPYWDVNDNAIFDVGDVSLPTLSGAYDTKGSTLPMPLLNQPPSVVFAQNPNDPAKVMSQPETTFTAATFAWVGSDPDGDQTIAGYEIALNDTLDDKRWVRLQDNINLISIVVPRERSDTATSEVTADIFVGKFSTVRILDTTISHLRMNGLNTFYMRARDVAGDVSKIIQMPAEGGHWYVKKPTGKFLIVSDYVASDSALALSFYRSAFAQIPGFETSEVLNIARGLTPQQKNDSKVGVLVPPFIDPAFVYTLHLFDLVFWFTDQIPSLAVAQYPLFQYVRDPVHHGKVIFSTAFESASDPRGALKDFAPIDSVSSVDLSNTRLLPTLGDTRVPGGFYLYPDSADPSNIYPALRFTPRGPFYSVYLRPIYRRPDAKYIYHIQTDTRVPARYAYSPVISELRSVTTIGAQSWACGVNGVVLSSQDYGDSWVSRTASVGSASTLHEIRFRDPQHGWVIGDGGAIYRTQDGGGTWANNSVITLENLYGLDVPLDSTAIIVGSNGLLIRSTNGGGTWRSPSSRTANNLRSVRFFDSNNGIAVGDAGTILKTTDGGASWSLIPAITTRNLASVRYSTGTTLYAVGSSGTLVKSTDGGDSWIIQSPFTGADLRGLSFVNSLNGAVSGTNGIVFQTQDGGATWTQLGLPNGTGISQPNGTGQTLTSITFSDLNHGIAVATGGIVITTGDGGLTWGTRPAGLLNVGVIDGVGRDGHRSFAFLSLPLHFLNGDGTNVAQFLEKVLLSEFGF